MDTNVTPTSVGLQTSEEIGQLAEALAAAHKDFKPVIKDAVNPFFKSKYADLANVIEATSKALSENKLVVIQSPRLSDTRVLVTTLLAHSSGQWIKDELELPMSKFDAQGAGSAITYARRYAYQSIVGVAAEADDDGNAASAQPSRTVEVVRTPAPTPAPVKPTPAPKPAPKKSVQKTDEPVQANQPERGEAVTASAEVSPNITVREQSSVNRTATGEKLPSGNIHGLNITDDDLPDNMQAKIPTIAVPEVDQKPSKEEKADIKKRLDGYGVPLTDIGGFIKRKYNLSSSGDLTKKQWSEIFSTLDSAKGNTDELKKILGGK